MTFHRKQRDIIIKKLIFRPFLVINNCYHPKITDKVQQFMFHHLDFELVIAGNYSTDKQKMTDKLAPDKLGPNWHFLHFLVPLRI